MPRCGACRCTRQLFCGHVSQGFPGAPGLDRFTGHNLDIHNLLHLSYFFNAIWCRRVYAAVGLFATASIDHSKSPTRCSCAACNKTLCSVYKPVSHIIRYTYQLELAFKNICQRHCIRRAALDGNWRCRGNSARAERPVAHSHGLCRKPCRRLRSAGACSKAAALQCAHPAQRVR